MAKQLQGEGGFQATWKPPSCHTPGPRYGAIAIVADRQAWQLHIKRSQELLSSILSTDDL